MHIGLIGGIGPAATEFYYRGLVRNSTVSSSKLELTVAHADMSVLLANMTVDARDQQAKVFRNHIEQLDRAGATVAAVTSIAGHFCFSELESMSPLPLVSALTVLEQEIARRRIRRVGLLGSQIAIESKLYGSLNDVEVVLPSGEEIASVSKEYFAMATAQRASKAQREMFFSVGARLCSEKSAEVVILAGTDMFLAFADANPGFEVIDCAEVHIQKLSEIAQKSVNQ